MKLDPDALTAARDRTLPDVLPALGEPLHVLFCGINPGLYSAATGWHFARPGNRFWPAPVRLHRPPAAPGRTVAAARPRARHHQRGRAGVGAGRRTHRGRAAGRWCAAGQVDRLQPRWLAVLGVTAYRTAFGQPRAAVGPQPGELAGARIWVLPNPSGLNALWTTPKLTEAFRDLRLHVGG